MSTPAFAAAVMAAGLGKRMGDPSVAKVMHRLGGVPLVERVVRLARRCGADPVVVVVGHRREQVIDHLATVDPAVRCVVQEPQLGTAHAVLQTAPILAAFDGDVVILSGDAPLTRPETLEAAVRRHRERGAVATVITARLPDPAGYGRVLRDTGGRVRRVVEDRDATPAERAVNEINSGMYVFRCGPLFAALSRVRPENAQGEYYLPDVVALFVRDGLPVEPFPVDAVEEIRGVNTPEQLAEMEAYLARCGGGG